MFPGNGTVRLLFRKCVPSPPPGNNFSDNRFDEFGARRDFREWFFLFMSDVVLFRDNGFFFFKRFTFD